MLISQEWGHLIEQLQHNDPSIQQVNLSRQGLSKSQRASLLQALFENRWVKKLSLSHSHIDNEDMAHLSLLLLKNQTLTHLDLSHNDFGHEGIEKLSLGLLNNKTLTHLNLSGNHLTVSSIQALAHRLIHNHCLRQLNLSHNGLTSESMQSLVHLLTYNTTIIDLNLSYNQLNPEGIKQLGVAFSQHNAIIRLNIGHNPLGSEGVVKLCQTLINNTTLRHLSLGHVGLGPTGAEALSYWLSTTAKLVSLQLPGNVLKSEGTKWLAASLAKNRHLKTLNLSMNQIDTQGAYQLSWLLSQTTTLSELDLSHNEIRDEAVYPLSMALRKNKGLTHFNLSHNPLVFSDINHLCASIGTHIHLQSVLLDNTHHSINEPYVTQYLSEIYHRNRKIAQADYLLTRLFSRISATNIHGAHARAFRIMEALQNHYFLKNTGVREKWIEHLIQFYQKYPGEILIDGLKQLLSSSIQTTWSRLKTLYALGTAYNHKGLSGNTAAFISAYVCFEQVANAHYEDGKTRLQVLKRKLKALYPDPRYLKYLIKQTMLTLHQKKWRTHKSPISNTLLFYFDTHSVFHHINLHQSMHLPILLNEVNEGPSVA